MSWFLELSLLDRFAAASYGAQQQLASERERLLGQFGEEEDHRLAEQMPAREITLCEDETFHPQICLVAIEPVSNFACAYAVASHMIAEKKQEYADRAMELLRQAVNAGWKDVAHMTNDTDLDPLREREDFQKLLESLPKEEPQGG